MKPSSGLQVPTAKSSRSESVRALRAIAFSSRARAMASRCSSPVRTLFTSCPPWGLISLDTCFLLKGRRTSLSQSPIRFNLCLPMLLHHGHGDRTPWFRDSPTTISRPGYLLPAGSPGCKERSRYWDSPSHVVCCTGDGFHGYSPIPPCDSSQPRG